MQIIQLHSPNFHKSRYGHHPEAIVIHIMNGRLKSTDNWFLSRNSQVSAHYGIGMKGEVHQYVSEEDTAWHAGRMVRPSWSLIKPIVNPNLYTIGIEHEGYEHSLWTKAMYEASSSLICMISKRWNIPLDRKHVIGHHEICATKNCPGNRVNMDLLICMALYRKYGFVSHELPVAKEAY